MKRTLVLLSIVMILILAVAPTSVQAGKGMKIASSTLKNPVTVDGKSTTLDEWTDGVDFNCDGHGWIALKDDSDFLYVLVDFTRDTHAEAGDSAWIMWDQKNDGGIWARSDDYDLKMRYETETSYDLFFHQGNGTGWGNPKPASSLGIVGASSTDATSDPHYRTSHLTYEFRLPRKILDNSTVITTVGFFAGAFNAGGYFQEGGSIALPSVGANFIAPNSWGQLTFSVPIPEFSQVLLTMALLVATLSIMLRRRKSATP